MYDLKRIQTIASASLAGKFITRPVSGPRAWRAINVRNPRILMGLIFLFLLLSYLIAYAQEYAGAAQPYLVVEPPTVQQAAGPGQIIVAQPDQPMPVPVTGR